jgi:dienelactone hydrolase
MKAWFVEACIALASVVVACGGDDARRPAARPQQKGPPVEYAAPLPVAGAESVTFASNDQDLTKGPPTALSGLLFRPAGAGPFPAVVALHGCDGLYLPGGQMAVRDAEWATRLRDKGYVVLSPDSFTPRHVHEECGRRENTVRPGAERTRDAYGALLYLQQQTWVHGDRIALLGWSHGATTVLMAAAAAQAARPKGMYLDFTQAIAFYPMCTRVLDNEKWRSKIPIEIFVGEVDDWTPAAPCMMLTERSRQAGMTIETVVYKGAYHDFDAPDAKVHVRSGVGGPSGRATVGTEPKARADAQRRVEELLAREPAPATAIADAGAPAK